MPRAYTDTSHIERRDERRLEQDTEPMVYDSAPMCPACIGGDGDALGTLGSLPYYRCRACGFLFSA